MALHNIAMIRARLGEYDEAERLYKQELDIVQVLGDEPARAHALNNLGDLEVSRRRFDVAVSYIERALAIRDRIGDDLGVAQTRGNLANVHSLQGDHQLALQLYQQSLDVFMRFGNRTEALRTLSNIARIKENIGQRNEAVGLLDDVLADPVAAAAPPLRAQALKIRGEIQQKEGENQAAADTFQELIRVNVSIGDVGNERDARAGLGIALKALGRLAPATAELRKALTLTEDHGLDNRRWIVENLADALNRDGLEREEQRDFESAMALYLEALEIWRRLQSPFNEGQTLRNIGNTYAKQQRYAEAASAFEQAAASLAAGDDAKDADEVSMTAGELYVLLGRLEEAGHMFRGIVTRSDNYAERAESMNQMGRIAATQLQHGEVNRALWILGTLANWNVEDGYPLDAAACLINIGSILKGVGDNDQARQALEQAIAQLDHEPAHPLLAQATALLGEIAATS